MSHDYPPGTRQSGTPNRDKFVPDAAGSARADGSPPSANRGKDPFSRTRFLRKLGLALGACGLAFGIAMSTVASGPSEPSKAQHELAEQANQLVQKFVRGDAATVALLVGDTSNPRDASRAFLTSATAAVAFGVDPRVSTPARTTRTDSYSGSTVSTVSAPGRDITVRLSFHKGASAPDTWKPEALRFPILTVELSASYPTTEVSTSGIPAVLSAYGQTLDPFQVPSNGIEQDYLVWPGPVDLRVSGSEQYEWGAPDRRLNFASSIALSAYSPTGSASFKAGYSEAFIRGVDAAVRKTLTSCEGPVSKVSKECPLRAGYAPMGGPLPTNASYQVIQFPRPQATELRGENGALKYSPQGGIVIIRGSYMDGSTLRAFEQQQNLWLRGKVTVNGLRMTFTPDADTTLGHDEAKRERYENP